MKNIPVLGMVLSIFLVQAPMAYSQDAEPPKQKETLQERRERQASERYAEKLAELQKPIGKVQAMINTGDLKPAFEGAREIRRRLGEPKHPQVEVLLAQLALIDKKPHLAVDFLEPFLGPEGAPFPEKFEASHFGIYYYHALGTMRHSANPDKEQRQALTQPGTQAFFGIPLDVETDTPDLTEEQHPKVQEALIVFDWLAGNAKGLDQVKAAQGAAQALTLLGDYKQAIQAYQFALNRARHGGLDEYFDSDGKNTLRAFIAELQRGLNEVRRLMDMKRYSVEFFLYRAADQQQRGSGNYKRAIEIYDSLIALSERNRQEAVDELVAHKLPPLAEDQHLTPREKLDRAKKQVEVEKLVHAEVPISPFSEAARINKLKCMLSLGQARPALKGLEQFIAEDELGLYRGEALMIVSTMALDRFNFDEATKWLGKLDAWVVNARADNSEWNFDNVLPGMRAAAKTVTDAPKQETKMDFWGNVKKQPIAHGRLVNRKTCPWYLDDLEERCAKYLGFMKLAEGDGEAALEQFKRIIDLDPNASDGNLSTNPNDFTRLKFGCEKGYLTTYPQDLEKLTKKQQMSMLYGDFLYVTQEFDRAIAVYQSVLDGRSGKLRPGREDCVYQAIGMAHLRKGSRDKAIEYWEKSLKDAHGTFSEYRSAYAIMMVTRHSTDKKLLKRGQQLLQALADSNAGNQFTQKARITLAMDLAKAEKVDEAKELLGTFKEEDGQHYALAQYLIKNDGHLVIPEAVKPEDRQQGQDNGRKWERVRIPGPPKEDEKQPKQEDKPHQPKDGFNQPGDETPKPPSPDGEQQEEQDKKDDVPDFFGVPTD